MIGPAPVRTVSGGVYALIAVMVLLWSSNFVVAKVALRELQPLALSALRTTIAAFLILPVYWWSRREQEWSWRDAPPLLILGVFGVALNQILFVYGLSRTTVSHSSLVIALTPMLVLIAAAVKGQERISTKKVLGMTVALGGVAVLQLRSGMAAGSLAGDVLILMAAAIFAAFTVAGKEAAMRHGSITVNTFGYVGGALFLAPVTLWHGASSSFAGISTLGWASIAYMALFPSVVCYLIYYYALSHIPATRVSAFAYLQPLLATMLALALLGERLSGGLVAGGLLVLAGVWVTERA